MDPLHYLSSRSDFGLEFADIFVTEKRLPDLASRVVGESATLRLSESLTPRLGESGSRYGESRSRYSNFLNLSSNYSTLNC